jgi:hypothetical protein
MDHYGRVDAASSSLYGYERDTAGSPRIGVQRVWNGIRRQNQFSLVNGVLSELKDDGRKAIYVTQQGRELRKRMLPPDPGPILSEPRYLGSCAGLIAAARL